MGKMSCVSQRRIRSLVPENICTIQRLNVSTSNSLDEVLAFRLGVPTSNFETTTERLTDVVASLHNETVRIASYLKAAPSKREEASIGYFACSLVRVRGLHQVTSESSQISGCINRTELAFTNLA